MYIRKYNMHNVNIGKCPVLLLHMVSTIILQVSHPT